MASNRIARLARRGNHAGQGTISTVMLSIFIRCKPRLRIIILAVAVSAMIGCGNSAIVGKWQMSGDPKATVWEFFMDRSVLIGSIRGRYSLGDNNRVKIQTPYATMAYHMEFWGDHMILTEVNGAKLEFNRIK